MMTPADDDFTASIAPLTRRLHHFYRLSLSRSSFHAMNVGVRGIQITLLDPPEKLQKCSVRADIILYTSKQNSVLWHVFTKHVYRSTCDTFCSRQVKLAAV